MTTGKRKTARDKLPNEPRRLSGEFADVPLPFTTDEVVAAAKRQRRAQGLCEEVTRRWT